MSSLQWKKVAGILLSVSVYLSSPAVQSAEEIPVLTLNLEMKARDADVLFKKDPYDRSTFAVSVLVDGERLNGRVAVKGSFTRNFDKKSLKIKLNKGSEWRGQRTIALNAMATDASMMREWLAWDLVHTLGMAAPRVNYTRLYINERYIGMFLHIDWIDTKLMDAYGLGSDGDLYHPRDESFCADLSPQSVRDPKKCWLKLSPRDGDFSSLKSLVARLDDVSEAEFNTYLEDHFDVESLINWLLVNVITSNGDTYNKNYFMYFSRNTQRWVMIPWDYDLSFGRNWDEFLAYPANILNDNFQYYYPLELGLANPLKNKLLKNPVLLKRLKDKLSALMGMPVKGASSAPVWFTPAVLNKRIDAVVALLADGVHRERYTNISQKIIKEQAQALKDYVAFRFNYLNKTVLQTSDWVADRANIKVAAAGDEKSWVDGFGKTLAGIKVINLNSAASINMEVEKMMAPQFVPEGVNPGRCIRRSWFLVDKTPYSHLKVDLSLQYLQENSKLGEVGEGMKNEDKLDLWVLYYDQWTRLSSKVNTISNVIETQGFPIRAGRLYRFVACQR